ncbi:MAG TPA: transposase [archaeon]|nr:transposase [archaeon]
MLNIDRNRRSIRLPDYDYTTPGAYFVTICTFNKECLFGEIKDDVMRLNDIGSLVFECWQGITKHFNHVRLDEFIVMPNHLHGILIIDNYKGEAYLAPTTNPLGPKKGSIGAIVGSFKSSVTRRANKLCCSIKMHLWQRGYYEHVLRNDIDLNNIRKYISINPARWALDHEDPSNQELRDIKPFISYEIL